MILSYPQFGGSAVRPKPLLSYKPPVPRSYRSDRPNEKFANLAGHATIEKALR